MSENEPKTLCVYCDGAVGVSEYRVWGGHEKCVKSSEPWKQQQAGKVSLSDDQALRLVLAQDAGFRKGIEAAAKLVEELELADRIRGLKNNGL